MKKIAILISIWAFTFSLNAQEQGQFRGSALAGYAQPAAGGGGVMFSAETQYNFMDNLNFGVRFSNAALIKQLSYNSDNYRSDVAGVSTYFGTVNYYFNDGSSSFAPFVGAGLGLSVIAAPEVVLNNERFDFSADSKFGGMLRGGFEIKKAIVGFEYNFISKSTYDKVTSTNGQSEIENVESKNAYFGILVGFFFGGGKWGG